MDQAFELSREASGVAHMPGRECVREVCCLAAGCVLSSGSQLGLGQGALAQGRGAARPQALPGGCLGLPPSLSSPQR